MLSVGATISTSQLAVLGEELRTGGGLTKGFALFISWECWGLGMRHAHSGLQLPLGHFPKLATLLVKELLVLCPKLPSLMGYYFFQSYTELNTSML